MKFPTGVAAGAFLFLPAMAGAQTAPAAPAAGQAQAGTQAAAATPTVGATVYDSAGVSIGTVEQVTPQAVVVNMGATKVSLPPNAIGSGPQGLRVAITKAEVEAAARQAQAGQQQQLASQLTPGTTVRGAGGAVVGTIKSSDGTNVTLTTSKGDVQLPLSGFGAGPNGPIIGMTAAQLDAAITAAGGGTAQAGASETTTGSGTTTTESTTTSASPTSGEASGTSSSATTTETTKSKRTKRPDR